MSHENLSAFLGFCKLCGVLDLFDNIANDAVQFSGESCILVFNFFFEIVDLIDVLFFLPNEDLMQIGVVSLKLHDNVRVVEFDFFDVFLSLLHYFVQILDDSFDVFASV